jgi:hydroxymethylpyrimidine pyrophosphatase-like HAD family hydrolase
MTEQVSKIPGKVPIDIRNPLIAIDFDGTITTYKKWQGVNIFDPPQPGARKALQLLKDKGYRILIWTTRNNKKELKAYLHKHSIPFDFINTAPVAPHQNPGKPACAFYIDDNAVRHTDWEHTLMMLQGYEQARLAQFCNWSDDFEHAQGDEK